MQPARLGRVKNIPTLVGRVNLNTAATKLPGTEPGAWLDTKQPRGPKQIGIQSAPGGTQVCALPLVEPQV